MQSQENRPGRSAAAAARWHSASWQSCAQNDLDAVRGQPAGPRRSAPQGRRWRQTRSRCRPSLPWWRTPLGRRCRMPCQAPCCWWQQTARFCPAGPIRWQSGAIIVISAGKTGAARSRRRSTGRPMSCLRLRRWPRAMSRSWTLCGRTWPAPSISWRSQDAQLQRLRNDLSLSRSHEQQLENALAQVTGFWFWKITWPARYLVSKNGRSAEPSRLLCSWHRCGGWVLRGSVPRWKHGGSMLRCSRARLCVQISLRRWTCWCARCITSPGAPKNLA